MQITNAGPLVTAGPVELTALPAAVMLSGVSIRPSGERFSLEPQLSGTSGAGELGVPVSDDFPQTEAAPLAGFEPLGAPPRSWTKLADLLPSIMASAAKANMTEEVPANPGEAVRVPSPAVSEAFPAGVHGKPTAEIPATAPSQGVPEVAPEPVPGPKVAPAERSVGMAFVAKTTEMPLRLKGDTMPEPAGAISPMQAADMQVSVPEQAQAGVAGQRAPGTVPANGETAPGEDHSTPPARQDRPGTGAAPACSDRIEVRFTPSAEGAQRVGSGQPGDPAALPVSRQHMPDSRVPGQKERSDRSVREPAQVGTPVETTRAVKASPPGSASDKTAERPAPAPDSAVRMQQTRTDPAMGATPRSEGVRLDQAPRPAADRVATPEARARSRYEESRGTGQDRQGASAVRTDVMAAPPSAVPFAERQNASAESMSLDAESPSDQVADGPENLHAVSSGKGDSQARTGEADHRPVIHARGAVAQIAEAVRLPMDGSVEVRLSPEELGRVKLTMVPGEAGLVVQLVAERPETLELLRRHVDTLAADLRDLGYSGLEFSFTNEGDEQRGGESARENSTGRLAESAVPAETTPAALHRGLAPDGRLDIRL